MGKNSKKIAVYILFAAIVAVAGYFISDKKSQPTGGLLEKAVESPFEPAQTSAENTDGSGQKTFIFSSFHGEDLGGGGFQFEYPAQWHNDGQYFSPIRIKYYDMVSVDAPVYFDLISTDLFETSGLKYQLASDKRRALDSKIKIDGKTFNRYDLIDYGSSGGESTGRVIIYVGPQVSFNGNSYYLVFRWEENPLTIPIPGNNPEVFEKMVSSLKFLK